MPESIASTTYIPAATAGQTTLQTVITRDAVPAPTAQSGDDTTAQSDIVTIGSASGTAPGSQSAMNTAVSSSIQPTQGSDDAERDNLFKVLVTFLARLKPDELDQIFSELKGPSVELRNVHKTIVDARTVSSTTMPGLANPVMPTPQLGTSAVPTTGTSSNTGDPANIRLLLEVFTPLVGIAAILITIVAVLSVRSHRKEHAALLAYINSLPSAPGDTG